MLLLPLWSFVTWVNFTFTLPYLRDDTVVLHKQLIRISITNSYNIPKNRTRSSAVHVACGPKCKPAVFPFATSYKPKGRGFDSQLGHWNFSCLNPSGLTVALGSTQPLTEMSTRIIS
jgi:hypothetical protein